MTSTITRTYAVGETYPASEVVAPYDSRCGNNDSGYTCTLRPHHQGDHVGAYSTGEVGHVWPNDTEPTGTPLDTWKRQVRGLAHTIVTSRGYGNFAVWNDTMVRLGLEPFTEKRVRVVAPIQRVVADLGSRYDEDSAREWLSARRTNLAGYLRPENDEIGEPTVEVTEDTPREDDSVEKDYRADTDDLDEYKAFVREVAIEMGTAQGWCDDGVNGVLDELGLPRKTREFRVAVQIQAYQTVYVDVTASDESAARDQVGRSTIRYAIDSSEWSWDGDWESDDVEVEEVL
jgi:hypothetical protein